MKLRYALIVCLLAGCGEEVYVKVNCVTTAAPAVDCTLVQTKGKSEVEVCFDFSATCDNGAVVTAAGTCGKVKGGGEATVIIPGDKLIGVAACGGAKPPVAKIENMTINGKASK